MNVSFHPDAESEFLDSVFFYESKTRGLGTLFIDEVEGLLSLIQDNPKLWPVAHPATSIYKATLKRFPFKIYYQHSHTNIYVLAIAHHRKRPNYWLNRQ